MPEFKEGPKSGRDWGRFTLEGKAMTFLNTPEMMSAIFPNGAKTNPADVLTLNNEMHHPIFVQYYKRRR